MYAFRTALGPVDLAFTDRYGGVSGVPFDQLNLALGGDDDPVSVAENLRIVLADFAPGATVADMRQVHGCDVAVVSGSDQRREHVDGLVTTQPDVVLMVRVADCVPVLLADAKAGVVGAAHAGRLGLQLRVVPATASRMRELGAETITAWIGPHVCAGCYEVPAAMQAQVAAVEPAALATTRWGTPSLDLGAGVRAQMERDGVNVFDVATCTRESPALYSHRRDGRRAGRSAGLIRVRP